MISRTLENLYAIRVFDKYNDPFQTITAQSWDDLCNYYIEKTGSENEGIRDARIRQTIEKVIYDSFVRKGGLPNTTYAFYYAICDAPIDYIVKNFTNPAYLMIPLSDFNEKTVSFTYGNAAVAFYRKDKHPTKRKVYTLNEIIEIINQYGLNIEYEDRKSFIEMQLWDNSKFDYNKYYYEVL